MCQNQRAKIWKPLISDPDILETYARRLGVCSKVSFQDVYSTEEWALELVNGEPVSVILLFPLTDALIKQREVDDDSANSSNQSPVAPEVWFMRQYIPNSCGAVALLHSILNNTQDIHIERESFAREISDIKDINGNLYNTRGLFLKENAYIERVHQEMTSKDVSHPDEFFVEVEHHYVSFIIHKDQIFELDGRLPSPINHGKCLKRDFLRKAIDIIKEKFISSLDESDRVAITVLCKGG